jgi:threonine/homoserine/homoserine lactone efflux protein
MSVELYLAYLAACIVVAVIPGPMVALVAANGLNHGSRAALLNVAGAQLGLALMLGTLVLGLASIIETLGWWFDALRLTGVCLIGSGVWLALTRSR